MIGVQETDVRALVPESSRERADLMRPKNRASRAVAALTVAATAATGLSLSAATQAGAAPERWPVPVPVPVTGDHGWSLWSYSHVSTTSTTGTTSPLGSMTTLRAQLDAVRATVQQRIHDSLADIVNGLAASPPSGVTLPARSNPPTPEVFDSSFDPPFDPSTTTTATTPVANPVADPIAGPATSTKGSPAPPATRPLTPQPLAPPTDPSTVARLELRRVADLIKAKPGDTVTHTVTVKNGGDTEASSAIVRNALPAGGKLLDSRASQGEFDTATGVWRTGRIKTRSEVTLILVLKVPEGAGGTEMIARSSFVSAPGAKPVIGNVCGDDVEASCASTRVVESFGKE
jgi:uncharacterized repeat protein (TIGR01451 family)